MKQSDRKVALIILDGWGYSPDTEHNPISIAETPCFDRLWGKCPHAFLEASGEAVGLPAGQMGNSEVGHTVIGAGKIVYTDLAKISKAAREKELSTNSALIALFDHVKEYDSVLHVAGLIGPGGVHSHSEHLYAFLRAADRAGIKKIAIHAFMDGRDTPPQSGRQYLKELEEVVDEIGIGFIATASGRFYAMDRDNNWDRLQMVENMIFDGKSGRRESRKPSEVIAELYEHGIIDEHIEPTMFLDDSGISYQIGKNDGVFLFNFRKDRAKMMTSKIIERGRGNNNFLVTMTEYDKSFPCLHAFTEEIIETTVAKEISRAGMRQAHIAETEKFAHCTYYLNGGKKEPYPGEEHILVESRKDIKTHDQAPEMKAEEITEKAIEQIEIDTNFIFINYANPDMIGHTGNRSAAVKAIESLDCQLGRLVQRAEKSGYNILITADHGNAEVIFDAVTKQPHTAHTTNKVPIIYSGGEGHTLSDGNLSDIAPTVLSLLKIPIPESMTGKILLK
ncbi:MAG: 2,3-bisphosphoglycerate-independent phosphoglycerate mutase [Patescibacteria group bacterium]|jgi:2,3-bisphosphoglycerate-independent phosphoglycerate mutase